MLSFIEKCRKKCIRTDVELRISEQSVLVHSYVLAAYSEVFHEFLFPEFYCNKPPCKDEESILNYSQKDQDNILQILKWMYTGNAQKSHILLLTFARKVTNYLSAEITQKMAERSEAKSTKRSFVSKYL